MTHNGYFTSEVVSRRKVEQTTQVQNYPHNKYYHATSVLRLRSLCNQGKNYCPNVYLDECKHKHSLSSDNFDRNLLRCKTFHSKSTLNKAKQLHILGKNSMKFNIHAF